MTVNMENIYKYCIFLDIDGVLNNEIFYRDFVEGRVDKESRRDNIDKRCIELFNHLFDELGGDDNVLVVMSSTWRNNYSNIEFANPLFKKYGAKWDFLDKTPNTEGRIRGVEIKMWLEDNCIKYFNIPPYQFRKYIILDDDADMLLEQKDNFFQTDSFCGLTPNLIDRIKKKVKNEWN